MKYWLGSVHNFQSLFCSLKTWCYSLLYDFGAFRPLTWKFLCICTVRIFFFTKSVKWLATGNRQLCFGHTVWSFLDVTSHPIVNHSIYFDGTKIIRVKLIHVYRSAVPSVFTTHAVVDINKNSRKKLQNINLLSTKFYCNLHLKKTLHVWYYLVFITVKFVLATPFLERPPVGSLHRKFSAWNRRSPTRQWRVKPLWGD